VQREHRRIAGNALAGHVLLRGVSRLEERHQDVQLRRPARARLRQHRHEARRAVEAHRHEAREARVFCSNAVEHVA
jgi:hypothetical protein